MKIEPVISSYTCLRNNHISSNGQTVFENKAVSTGAFLQAAYETLGINYPKFFKMDSLCKTGFLAVELLLQNQDIKERFKPEEIAIVISCANSSLDTDLRYEHSIAEGASPALFVYTLPNILIGELAIRNGIKGESACFVFDIFDAPFQTNYINSLFETGKIKACISGWADFMDEKAEAFFCFTEITDINNQLKHDSLTVSKIFSQSWKN